MICKLLRYFVPAVFGMVLLSCTDNMPTITVKYVIQNDSSHDIEIEWIETYPQMKSSVRLAPEEEKLLCTDRDGLDQGIVYIRKYRLIFDGEVVYYGGREVDPDNPHDVSIYFHYKYNRTVFHKQTARFIFTDEDYDYAVEHQTVN